MTAATAEGTIAGTTSYMSPEQAEAKPLDGRTDIFSFGSVMDEMLTGRRAFDGESAVRTLSAIVSAEPTPSAPTRVAPWRSLWRGATGHVLKS
jgi:eukaryotic-like serine/threonine-protein kinase